MKSPPQVEVEIDGRTLRLTNLDKVLWPTTGFTKGQLIDYYARIAPVLLPHLEGRPVTLRRYPNGVDAGSFFEKNCPGHRPPWVSTITIGDVSYCRVDEPAALVWLANLAAIELHPGLARAPHLDRPTALVFDLDPGAPADALTCGKVAMWVRDLLARLGMASWVKTSGSKGLQVYAPLRDDVTFQQTKPFALTFARLLEREHPDAVVTTQDKAVRRGKVLIDWSQNTASKTTVAAYSVRALAQPSVSTPLRWEELEQALAGDDLGALRFGPGEVLGRVAADGDLLAPLTQGGAALPELSSAS